MKRILLTLCLCFTLMCGGFTQNSSHSIRRIPIFHADPEFILRILKGDYVTQPEYSVLRSSSQTNFSNSGRNGSGFGGANMGGQFGVGREGGNRGD